MSDIRYTLMQEAEALEAELRQVQVYVKLQKVRELLALYDGAASDRQGVRVQRDPRLVAGPARVKTRRAPNPDRERALAEAADYIRGRTAPTKTAEILEYLELMEVPIAGTVPLSNLSAMLHHSPMFQSHGRRGWTLPGAALTSEKSESASSPDAPADNVTEQTKEDPMASILG